MSPLSPCYEWLNDAPEAILVVNTTSEIVFINQKALALLEYPKSAAFPIKLRDIFPDTQFSDLIHPDRAELVKIRNAKGAIIQAEASWNTSSAERNEYRIISFKTNPIVQNTPASVTEQYKLLVKSIDKLPEGIQILDHNFRYLYLNDIVVAQSKFKREELLGHTMPEKYPGVENTYLFKEMVATLKDGQSRSMTNEFVFPDGSVGFFNLNIEPIPEGLFIISLDITDIIRFREALIEKNRKLEIMNTELEQFAYIASHDLQEPLKTISSCLRMLGVMTEGKLEKDPQQLMQFMNTATVRMQELIRALLEYSRVGKEPLDERVECNEILRQVISDMHTSIEEANCKIESEHLPVIMAIGSDMRMLFQNLISNAIKFRKKDIAPVIKIRSRENEDYWIFSVEDNGIGIEEKYLDKIFAIFQRLHLRHEYEGTGIGLARCKKTVQLHGGDIWVESEPGSGSCFSFSISKKSPV